MAVESRLARAFGLTGKDAWQRQAEPVAGWTMINLRAFPPPRSLDNWASWSVLGERDWSARTETPILERHRVAPIVLSVTSAVGVPFWAWGLIVLDVRGSCAPVVDRPE